MNNQVFYKDNVELRKLAQKCINKYEKLEMVKFYEKDVKIGFQWSEEEKVKNGKVIFGDCEKVKNKLKEFTDYDFIITFYASAHNMSEKAQELLMYHELRHIGISVDECGDMKFSIIPHEIEDFLDIVEENGLNWCEK